MRLPLGQVVSAQKQGTVDLNAHFNLPRSKIAYAFSRLPSRSEQTAQCFLGSGDGVKVWLNGQSVFEKPAGFFEESCIQRKNQFPLTLRAGENALLLKVESRSGDWGFIVEVAEACVTKEIIAEQTRLKRLRQFQDDELRPKPPSGFVLAGDSFSEIEWSEPCLVEELWGTLPLHVRWFDGALNEVRKPGRPGRYAAFVQTDLPGGRQLRRALTFFCVEPACEAWREPVALHQLGSLSDS